jgi:hypothetical protein
MPLHANYCDAYSKVLKEIQGKGDQSWQRNDACEILSLTSMLILRNESMYPTDLSPYINIYTAFDKSENAHPVHGIAGVMTGFRGALKSKFNFGFAEFEIPDEGPYSSILH